MAAALDGGERRRDDEGQRRDKSWICFLVNYFLSHDLFTPIILFLYLVHDDRNVFQNGGEVSSL